MTILDHTCPQCDFTVYNKTDAKKHFGYRQVKDKEYCQSFCRGCKLKHSQEMRKLKIDQPEFAGHDLRVFK